MRIQEILGELDKQYIEYVFYGNREQEIERYSCSKRRLPNSVMLVESPFDITDVYTQSILFISDQMIEYPDISCLITSNKEDVYYKIVEILSLKSFYLTSQEDIIRRFPNSELDLDENVQIAEIGVTLSGKIKIGKNVIIKSGAVIGAEGYEFLSNKCGQKYRIPSQGNIVIGDNVEIGANVCVDRGVYGDTIIGDNVKIANLCQIGHDVIIGNNTTIASKVSVSSFTEIGCDCILGAGATIKDNIKLGNSVFVGMGAVVTESIVDKHTVFGNPAVEYKRKKKLLKVDHINKTYGGDSQKTLDDISFEIATGEFVSIVGPSGCGKTTLLKIMAGLLDSESGELISKKKNMINIGMIFQDDALLPWFTVEKNVGIGLKIQKTDKAIRRDKIKWAIQVVGLEGYEKYYPYQLSGGMKKRTAIARSLVVDSELLLMDEPFGALDTITKTKIQEDLLQLQKENGFSVCMVTHDIEEAIALSDRIIVVGGKPARVETIVSVNMADRKDHNSEEFLSMKKSILTMMEEK